MARDGLSVLVQLDHRSHLTCVCHSVPTTGTEGGEGVQRVLVGWERGGWVGGAGCMLSLV